MLDDPRTSIEGEPLTYAELTRVSACLYAKGLVRGITIGQPHGIVRAGITEEGEECVRQYGADVHAYLHRDGDTPLPR